MTAWMWAGALASCSQITFWKWEPTGRVQYRDLDPWDGIKKMPDLLVALLSLSEQICVENSSIVIP